MTVNILVVYTRALFRLRVTTKDHLYCFKRYSEKYPNYRFFYINSAFRIPKYIFKVKFDLIIFHTTYLSKLIWRLASYSKCISKKDLKFKQLDAIKIAITQDEFVQTNHLCQFINDFEIQYVFSAAEKSEWKNIYHTVDFSKVNFKTVLTGYLENKTIEKIKSISKNNVRHIDIGYRMGTASYWLGYHGYLKTKMANIFLKHAPKWNFKLDISTKNEDTFVGMAWYRFLLNCKYTIGVESGASLIDKDGSIRKRVKNYLDENPRADFEQVEEVCFKGMDGNLKLFALSPRHLEACATKTCQILVKGNYNGILKPGVHYIELKKDFSNINEVLKMIKDDSHRERIVNQAYKDVVKSEKFTYTNFVHDILTTALDSRKIKTKTILDNLLYHYNLFHDWYSWIYVCIKSKIIQLLVRYTPEFLKKPLRAYIG